MTELALNNSRVILLSLQLYPLPQGAPAGQGTPALTDAGWSWPPVILPFSEIILRRIKHGKLEGKEWLLEDKRLGLDPMSVTSLLGDSGSVFSIGTVPEDVVVRIILGTKDSQLNLASKNGEIELLVGL